MTTGETNTTPNKRRSFWEWLDDRYKRFCYLPRMRQVVEGASLLFVASAAILVFCYFTAELVGYKQDKTGGVVLSPAVQFFRDLMVALAAAVGITIAARRTSAFDRQAKTAEKRLLNERFATAAKLMVEEIEGKPAIAARVSGINVMGELASAEPEFFLRQTVSTMVAYIKDNVRVTAYPPLPPKGEMPDTRSMLGEDVKAAFWAIQSLYYICGQDVPQQLFPSPDHLDFSHCDFSHLDLSKGQLHVNLEVFKWESADLSGTNLHEASLGGANLTKAILHGADLSGGVSLCGATLTGAQLQGANLEEVRINDETKWGNADLSWVSLRKAFLDGNDWNAKFFATDLSGATIKKPPQKDDDKKSLDGKVRHSENSDLPGIREQNTNVWCLESCPSTSALVGAFRNFSFVEADENHPAVRLTNPLQRGFHAAAVRLREERGLPEDLPEKWKEWLEKPIEHSAP